VDAIPALLERFGVCGMPERRNTREPAADSAASSTSGQSA
jgi:hypothetical protein